MPNNNSGPYTENLSDSRFQPYDYVALHFDEAIGRHWFKVSYQPAIRSLSGKIAQIQALPRWEDPLYGRILPNQFLPAVRDKHVLYRLDLYVLESVCRAIHDFGYLFQIALSLSADSLDLPDLHSRILYYCSKYSVPHELLSIVITEETIARDIEAAANQIRRFHEEGFEIWLDNFGNGPSSFSIVTTLKLDGVRIDTSLLPREYERTDTVLKSLIDASRKLGLDTLASGVETQKQADFLRRVGCDLIQGAFFSLPKSLDALRTDNDPKKAGVESLAQSVFFRHLAKSDLTLPDFEATGQDEGSYAILMRDGDASRFLYASDSFQQLFSEFTETKWNAEIIPRDLEDGRLFENILRVASVSRRTRKRAQFDFAFQKKSGRLEIDFITEYLGMSAYRIRISGVDDYPEHLGKDASEAADICNVFDNVWKLDLKDNHWSSLFGLMQDIRILEQIPGRGASNLFATAYLIPEECGKYMDFVNPDTLEKRISLAGGHTINGFFHMKDDCGKYVLKRISVSRFGKESDHKYLFLVSRNLVGWSDAELYKLAGSRRIPSDMDLNYPRQDWIIDKEAVMKAVARQQKLCIFWKDSQRRLIDANKTFLSYFHVALSDIYRQKDEQLGWFPEEKKLRKEEEKILEKGNTIIDRITVVVADGQRNRVIMSKVPVYERGRIIGLAGYFLDITDPALMAASDIEMQKTDKITGFLNEAGFYEVLEQYEEKYQTEKKDFCLAHFRIKIMKKFRQNYGQEKYAELVRLIAHTLRENAPAGSAICRGIGEQYLVLAPADDISRMIETRKKLDESIASIRKIGDSTPVTVYFSSCVVLYSRFGDVDDMLAASSRGMRDYL